MTDRESAHGAWHSADLDAFAAQLTGRLSQYGLCFVDADGRITGWSEGCHAITGFTADEVLGGSAAILFTSEDVDREIHLHEFRSAELLGSAEDERWHMRKDGSRFWASGITLPLAGDGDRPAGFAKLFRDATHLRQRTDLLDGEARQLRKDRNDRNVLLATIAHELRNPLQPMAMAAALLAQPSDGPLHEQALKIIDRQIGFMNRLVEDLIDMTRMTEGLMRIVHHRVALQPLLREALDACRHAAQEKRIDLVEALPPVPLIVEVDAGRMHQVLTNLLGNAIKFTPEGGRVALFATADHTHFTIKVQDTGQGIGADLQPRIFDMFTQARAGDTGRGQGLGIGLALVREIVSLHQGSVEVRSEGAGQGSEFFVRMPLVRPSEVRAGLPAPAPTA
jgi:two-component system CheB/CheR fusion protein